MLCSAWMWKRASLGTAVAPSKAERKASRSHEVSDRARAVYRLPTMDRNSYLREHPVRKGVPLRFAQAVPVALTPQSHGRWESDGTMARWRLLIDAPEALNLNFGFSRFTLPDGASLELRNRNGELLVRPFTAADNDAHGELWTPVVAGSAAELVVDVPERERRALDLELGWINRGFRAVGFAAKHQKIGNASPGGDCHIDVVCTGDDAGVSPAIEAYRDPIRSAAVFTLGGVDKCSGAAINNTSNDRTPYFLTAHHCGVRIANAPSMVAYWNFENSTCRTPGSVTNGENGDGPLSQFNSGAIFRATHVDSDATLVEFDDPLNPAHEVFLAGWSRTGTSSMSAIVHFPNLSEKRISFDFDSVLSTAAHVPDFDVNGTHWKVGSWDLGSTEGGSSGAPLFDQDGRIVGQLDGGLASCGNNESDWFGKLARAWTGGGTPSSRLRDWLDPAGTGALTLDGLGETFPRVRIEDAAVAEGDEGTTLLEFLVELDRPAGELIELTYRTNNFTATSGSDYTAINAAPLSFDAGESLKMVTISINGDEMPEPNEEFEVVLALKNGSSAILEDARALGTIINDDYIAPLITGPSSINATVAERIVVSIQADNTPTSYELDGAPPGMTIDAEGVLHWIPLREGAYAVVVTAANPAGSDTAELNFTVVANPLATALEVPSGVVLRSGGRRPWVRSEDTGSIQQGDLAENDRLFAGQSSWLEAEVEGPDYLGFWWKVSSEANFDFLHVDVDGERRGSLSGEVDWRYMVVSIGPGVHTVRWTYAKDLSGSAGADRAYVDFLQLASQNAPFLMESNLLRATSGVPVDYRIPVATPGATFAPVAVSDQLAVLANGGLAGIPAAPGVYNYVLTVAQDGTAMTVPMTVEVFEPSELGAAVDQPDLVWVEEGDGDWKAQGSMSRDGSAAEGGGVPHDGEAKMSAYVAGPGTVSFWWKVSSEPGFDGLEFAIDGEVVASLTGSVDWAPRTFEFSYGLHKLTWSYQKDQNATAGADAGWVDNVEFGGYLGWARQEDVGGQTNVAFDHDRDGQSMFFEYATGGSATLWDAPLTPAVNGSTLEWAVPKRPGVRGAVFDAEVSDDLLNWTTSERTVEVDDEAVFRARDNKSVPSGARFLRGIVHPEK